MHVVVELVWCCQTGPDVSIERALSETARLARGSAGYPQGVLACLGDAAPESVSARGNVGILERHKLGFFCSKKCPGSLIIQTYDVACALRDAGVTVVSGFHSPMEKECLTLLLRGSQPIIVGPARGIERMRLPREWREPLDQGRLLLLSPFAEKHRRPTVKLALARNDFVAVLADAVLFAHAEPGGKTEGLCRRVIEWGTPAFTLDNDANASLVARGARPVTPEGVASALQRASSAAGRQQKEESEWAMRGFCGSTKTASEPRRNRQSSGTS